MAREYNYYGDSYGSKSERQSLAWVVAKIIFMLVATGAAVLLALTLFTPIVNPAVWSVFPLLGVAAPVVYIVNFAFAMVLIVRWKLKFALPIIVLLLIGGGKISRYAKMDFSTHYDTPSYRGTTKIMSFNLRSHFNDQGEWSTPELITLLDSISPDILCVQEFNLREFNKHASTKLKKLNLHNHSELGIFSRYPIVAKSEYILLNNEDDGASRVIWADLKISNDTIRVFNCHLTSTTINKSDDEYISSQEFIADSKREYKFRDMVYRLKRSAITRAQHADSIAHIIALSPHKVVVCGDFNDTPMSYTYRAMAQDLNDSFSESGVGFPYTYRGFMNMLRIDYILACDDIEFKSYMVDTGIDISDHHPVISRFSILK
ncbi:MAG: endonuclease/exonuclease/phosphatase family protein [Rikenellaceae bacterium]